MGGFNEGPLVSIILPCFNSERYLAQTLDSIRAQTYSNWELVAVDDCSTDRTLSILSEAAAADKRIRVIVRTENGGRPSVTKNTGIAEAKGGYIQFIDHDDVYSPRKTEILVRALAANPDCCAAFSNINYLDRSGVVSGLYLNNFLADAQEYITGRAENMYVLDSRFFVFQLLNYAAIHTISCMIAKDRLIDFNFEFDAIYTITDDTDFWIRLGLQGRLVYVDDSLAFYRLHERNLTNQTLLVAQDVSSLIARNRKRVAGRLKYLELRKLRARESSAYSSLGWNYRVSRQGWLAFKAYCQALNAEFSLGLCWAAVKSWLPVRGL